MIGRGFAPAAAARFAGIAGFAALVSRGVTGWVLDRVQAPRVLATITLIAVMALLLLSYGAASPAMYYLTVLMLGSVIGAEVDVAGFMVRRYFPSAVFGRLYGFLFMLFALGGGTGPIIMGSSFDHLGGYTPGLLLFAGLGIIAGLAALALPRYDAERSF